MTNMIKAFPKIKQSRRIISLSLALLILLGAAIVAPPKKSSAAGSSSMYISPASQSVTAGNNVSFNVIVNTNGNSVNAVQTTVSYNASLFNYVSVTAGAFSTGFISSNSSGSINFSGGSTGPLSGVQTAATIVLYGSNAGTSAVSLSSICTGTTSSTCSAVLDYSTSQNDLTSISGGSLTVNSPPAVSSGGSTSSSSSTGSSVSGHSTANSTKSSGTTKSNSAAPATAPSTPAPNSPNPPSVSNIKLLNESSDSVTVSWQTNVPTSSIVNYGLTNKYGLVAQNSAQTTNHSITLTAPFIVRGATYYIQVSGLSATNQSVTAAAPNFKTPGFSVTIVVSNKKNQPLKGASVTLAGQTKTTNSQGAAAFDNISAGKTTVTIKSGSSHTSDVIQVGKFNPATKTYALQQFKLTAGTGSGGSSALAYIVIAFLIIFALIGYFLAGPTLKNWFSQISPPKTSGSSVSSVVTGGSTSLTGSASQSPNLKPADSVYPSGKIVSNDDQTPPEVKDE